MNLSIAEEKRIIRKTSFSNAKAIPSKLKRAASASICEQIRAHALYQNSHSIFAYLNLASEPDLTKILFAEGKRWLFPRIDGKTMDFFEMSSFTDAKEGAFGIQEPDLEKCGSPVLPNKVDLVLVPGVAFNAKSLDRLGRGKGFYDSFLEQIEPRPKLIGICYAQQLFDNIPIEDHDIPMDNVVFA